MSSITEQKSRSVSIIHVCSVCGSPVVLNSVLVAKIWSSAFSPPTVDSFLDDFEDGIRNFAGKRKALGRYGGKSVQDELEAHSEWVSGNTTLRIMVPHLEEGCPYCGFREVWQYDSADEEQLSEIPEEYLPTLVKGTGRAELWAKEKLLASIQSIHEEHRNPDSLANAKYRQRMLLAQLQAEEAELNERPLKRELDAIEKRIAQLEENRKQFGTFQLKEKKPISKEIEKLIEEKVSTRSRMFKRENELKRSVPVLSEQAKRNHLIITDVTDQAEQYITLYSYAYHPIPKRGQISGERVAEAADPRTQPGPVSLENNMGFGSLLLRPGSVIGNRFMIEGVLGKGEYGVSYCARTRQNTRAVLIEYAPMGTAVRMRDGITLCPVSREKQSIYENGKAEFLNDVGSIQVLGENGYYARIMGWFELNGTAYCVSEYLENVNPGQYIPDAFYGM